MHMEFLQAQVPQPKLAIDFKQTTFEFEANYVYPLDKMDMHRKTREMVYSTFNRLPPLLPKAVKYASLWATKDSKRIRDSKIF